MKTDSYTRKALAAKTAQRQALAKLPYENKVAIVVQMQQLARDMARASHRPFKGCVWG